MGTVFQTLSVFVISLSVLLFFGPIIVIIAIIGNVQLGPVHIDLSNRTVNTRVLLAVVGIGSWLALYVPLVSLASKSLVTAIPNSTPVSLTSTSIPAKKTVEIAASNLTTASAFWNNPDLSFPSYGILDRQTDESGKCVGGGDRTHYWLLPDHETGWVQIDLGQNYDVVKVRWLNTHNGRCGGNRATTSFHIGLSQLGDFSGEEKIIYSGEMTFSNSSAYEETILSSPISARYVRFYVDDYFGEGGGLNELEVYAEVPY